MTIKERYHHILQYFQTNQPFAETELVYQTPYELLVSVVLSAQCTDVRVNLTTPALFRAFPNQQKLAKATQEEVFEFIKSISYPNSKAKHLVALAQMLESDFGGEIPLEVDQLMKLPGVGRKTANVITSVLDQQPNMAVDTHVYRVSHRLGLVNNKENTPLSVEKKLIKYIPKEQVHIAHHWLILHGRYVCKARNPQCEECPLKNWCKYYENITK